jgi:hypothetical protein
MNSAIEIAWRRRRVSTWDPTGKELIEAVNKLRREIRVK